MKICCEVGNNLCWPEKELVVAFPFPSPSPLLLGRGKEEGGEERRPNFCVSAARPPPDEQGRPSPPPSFPSTFYVE